MAGKRSLSKISITLFCILLLTMITATVGFFFRICDYTRDTSPDTKFLKIQIGTDYENDLIIVTNLKDSIEWSKYKVLGNNLELHTLSDTTGIDEMAFFYGLRFDRFQEIKFMILDIEKGSFIFSTIINADFVFRSSTFELL